MWNIDGETIIQILVLVLIFGGAILRFLYRAFVKPLADAEARRREAAGRGGAPPQDPATALRDFLAELRGDARPGQAPPGALRDEEPSRRRPEVRPEPVPEEIRWDPRQQPAPRQRPAAAPVPGRPVAGRPGRAPAPGRPQRGAGPRARPAAQPLAELVEDRPTARPGPPPAGEDRFKFEGGDLRAMTSPSTIESSIGGRIAERFAASAADAATASAEADAKALRRAPRVIPGLNASLRDAVLAQVVLGTPRFRTRRPGRLGPGRA